MTAEKMQKEYEKNSTLFDAILAEVEQSTVKWEYYHGPFYEITPFSYQRYGYNQGKIIKNINRLKNMRNVFCYGFDAHGNIVEIKEGLTIPGGYNYEFIFRDENELKVLNYNNRKILRNISLYILDRRQNVVKMFSQGRRGYKIEEYSYDSFLRLDKITIKQFDENREEGVTLLHTFQYDDDNILKSITKAPVSGTYSEIIYKLK